MSKPPFYGGRVHVMTDKCETCIFLPGNLMRLTPGRVKEMVDSAVADESAIICHKTIHGQAKQEAVCRGFYDAHANRVLALRLAQSMGLIAEV